MRLVEGDLCWSATDLTIAAQCEYQLLRRLDVLLGRGEPPPEDVDPLREQVARVGALHEERVRQGLEATHTRVVALDRPGPTADGDELAAMHRATLAALRDVSGVVHQAGFFDGEFLGFADFLVAGAEGWVVCDAKLARQARPVALLQLGAYAEQLRRAALPLAPMAKLLLGDGSEESFDLADVLPVFAERRARLRALIGDHAASGRPVHWGREDLVACGRCEWCGQAAHDNRDLLLVAGMRMSQRALLLAGGARTIDDLAAMTEPPAQMLPPTFEKLRAQARLQAAQLAATPPGAEPAVSYELVGDGSGLRRLPPPSDGDVFFDFEGDPLHREDDPPVWGLEYLWGVTEAPVGDRPPPFRCWWAHDRAEERRAFEAFMDYVAQRRAAHPDMHVYHYAPYETTALKRLAGRYATRQAELDELLRAAVFVDLYAVVRGSVRVSQPSYSLKKLEPLYMGDRVRAGMDVTAGDASIAEYHEARALAEVGDHEAAQALLQAIQDYNQYDCESTLGLRDWLLGLAEEHDVPAPVGPGVVEERVERGEENQELVAALRARSGPAERAHRTAEEQAYAMLASAVGYHRRESLPFWWEHFGRLATDDVGEWRPDRDVFRVDSAEVLDPWHVPERAQTHTRRLRLRGRWGPGSSPGRSATVIYRVPCPEGTAVPEGCNHGWRGEAEIQVSALDEGEVVLVERTGKEVDPFDAVPVALGPPVPPRDGLLREAVRELADDVRAHGELSAQPGVEVLRRRAPRLSSGGPLPHTGDAVDDLVAALLDLDRSYLPVQGPPGTGKTWTGSRVVKRLVEDHGWRIGVVSQSHAVVENMLSAVCRAGLDPDRIGKVATQAPDARWQRLKDGAATAAFLAEHEGDGCVVGGTAWTFANPRTVDRGCLDLVVVDEAGQFALANMLAVSVAAPRLLLLGDPQQLPQVSQGTHDEPVHLSALRWVMGDRDTIPAELGYFLATTYRMHPALCAKVSALSYGGELASADVTETRRLDGVAPGLHAVRLRPTTAASVASEDEAALVVGLVDDLVGRRWHDPEATPVDRPLDECDVLVVAPYNAQVSLIRRRLVEAGRDRVRVGTVDRFQGQEAPVVIVSMTASSAAEVPRGMRFLLNRNRVNVAVSRAQWCAYLLRAEGLTSYLPRTPDGLLELGAFIALTG